MTIIKNIVVFINDYNWIITFLIFIIGLLAPNPLHILQTYRKHALLSFTNKEVEIIAPVRKGTITDDSTKTKLKWDYITYDESQAIANLYEIVSKAYPKILITSMKDMQNDIKGNCRSGLDGIPSKLMTDAILLGGPLAHNGTKYYFQKFFRGFRIGCPSTSNYITDINRDALGKMVYEEENDDIGTLSYAEQIIFRFLREDEGYIVLLKLRETSFETKRTIIALFGNNAISSARAVDLLSGKTMNYLYSFLRRKGHLNRFFLIIPTTSSGDIHPSKEIVDLTDTFFNTGELS